MDPAGTVRYFGERPDRPIFQKTGRDQEPSDISVSGSGRPRDQESSDISVVDFTVVVEGVGTSKSPRSKKPSADAKPKKKRRKRPGNDEVRTMVAYNFDKLFNDSGLSMASLARKAKASSSQLHLISDATTGTGIDMLADIANALNVPVSRFFVPIPIQSDISDSD